MKKLIAWCLIVLPLGFAQADVPSAEALEARANLYRFGEGYTQAAIDLVAAPKVTTTVSAGWVKKEYRDPGLQVSWLEASESSNKPVPLKLSVRRKGHLASDIVIGTSDAAQLRRLLGEPDARGPNWISYQGLAEVCSDKFVFRFASGKLSEVEWQWCTD